jgi:hypothetical protein
MDGPAVFASLSFANAVLDALRLRKARPRMRVRRRAWPLTAAEERCVGPENA